jgi:hypothetical protein
VRACEAALEGDVLGPFVRRCNPDVVGQKRILNLSVDLGVALRHQYNQPVRTG